jgi:hypothetical protein
MEAEFAVNARTETVAQEFRRILRPWGYLIPPSGLTRKLRASVTTLANATVPLIVDNGKFDDITRISRDFSHRIAASQAELADLETRLQRAPRWRDLRALERQKRERLAADLAASARPARTAVARRAPAATDHRHGAAAQPTAEKSAE